MPSLRCTSMTLSTSSGTTSPPIDRFSASAFGMQLLFSTSLEDGLHQGLDIIPGTVRRFQLPTEFKIPHMGWNQLSVPHTPAHPLFNQLPENPWFYFVHSYHCVPEDTSWVAASTHYGAAFRFFGCPQQRDGRTVSSGKSQSAGLQLLRNFVSCSPSPPNKRPPESP
ncbi:MAG UNVERIFIED_CONTAM: hypothetical protein LVR18_37690 [Planctomycetaceae bacterium]|jgi:glutamine amidotransferase